MEKDGNKIFLSNKEILNISNKHPPLAVLSYNHQSVIATLINLRKKSRHSHIIIKEK